MPDQTTYTYCATIGTDRTTVVGASAPPADIDALLADLTVITVLFSTATYSHGTAHGVYVDDAGATVHEDSATATGTVSARNLPLLRSQLAALGTKHDQETVGFIVQEGTDTLVPSA